MPKGYGWQRTVHPPGRRIHTNASFFFSFTEELGTPHDKYTVPHNATWSERLGALFDSSSDGDLKISVVEDGHLIESMWAHRLILHQNPNFRDYQTPLSIRTTSNCSQHARAFIR